MEKIPYISCNSSFKNGYGSLTIEGLEISMDFMSRFFAQYKKEIAKDYHIGVSATFLEFPEENNLEIRCLFLENIAYAEKHNIDPRIHAKRFEETFGHWISNFEEILDDISFKINDGKSEDQIFKDYYPEAFKRRKRKERKAAAKKAAKRAKKHPQNDINGTNTAKASL
ncbi:hypothetical protein IKF43_00055 [Candidatus Saccharibacteria bacterium]|nr:hypothetical protein [Candidatus Saccharibacteria bacterium]